MEKVVGEQDLALRQHFPYKSFKFSENSNCRIKLLLNARGLKLGRYCWQSVFLSKFQQRLYKETLFSPKGEWDETLARHAREEKQTADSSHVFEDIHTCQNTEAN